MREFTRPIIEAEAIKKTKSAVKRLYDIARITIGPEGKNALLPRTFNRGPRNTNDGVTILENCKFEDEYEALVGEFFKESSKKTNELGGDGTTGTAVIAGALTLQILEERGMLHVPSATLATTKTTTRGVRATRKEMKDAKEAVLTEIKARSKPIKTIADLENIAIISIGKEDEESAKQVAKLVWEIGRDGAGNYIDNHIDVVEGYKGEIELEKIVGMRFPSKVAHRSFVTNKDRFEMVAEDVHVFITNYKLDNSFDVVEILNKLKVSKIALFAPDFSNNVIQSLIATTKNGIFCYPVKCPSLRTEQMEDLAVYTNATVIDKDTGRKLLNVTNADLGFATKIVVKDTENREDAVLLGGKGEKLVREGSNAITDRCLMLKKQIKESQNELTTVSLQKRIANLSSAVGVIRVGQSTSGEGLFLKLKIEDGVYACKRALEAGYVKGGGLCLKEIAEKLPEGNILKEALQDPYNQIQKNAGGNLEIEKNVIDAAKIVALQVEHAVSIASMLITTEILIPDVREKGPAEGYEMIARAIAKYVYYDAKHKGMIKESEDEAEMDREKAFANVMLADKG